MIVAVYSKYITQTYYGVPVDHCTITVHVSPEMSPEEVEIVKENARMRLKHMPVENFPVAGAHASLMNKYHKRHPELLEVGLCV